MFSYFRFERTYLVLTCNVIFSVCFKATNRGRTTEASAILEGALADNFTVADEQGPDHGIGFDLPAALSG